MGTKESMQKLNSWITLATNVGVLVGIALLLVELSQNTDALKAQDEYANLDQWTEFFMSASQSPDLARVVIRGNASYASLSPEEALQYNGYIASFCAIAEQSFYSILSDRYYYGESEHGSLVRSVLSSPGAREYWAANKSFLTPEFREWVDELLANSP